MLLCAFKENAGIFRTNFSRNTSDHLSKKAAYTEAIPYKTGIGITTPQELEAIHDAPASFFVSTYTHTSTMVGCMGPTSVGLVSSNASCGNPVQSTASELTTSGGGYNPKVRGAFHMAVSARTSDFCRPYPSGGDSCLKPSASFPVLLTSAAIPLASRRT
ncbi:hypothetical protein B9H19_002192 [Escherichia coli]|nr:hypothetical protein [Escherichia coli]EFF2638027.1 hypothetical protein [Escherichia coli]EFK4582995.1 hypothetical protein [Escherichia coli]